MDAMGQHRRRDSAHESHHRASHAPEARVLPSLIDLMASNRHHDLPRIVFEVGRVVHDHRNRWRASLLVCEADGGFARIRGITQAVMSDLQVVHWSVTPTHPDRGPH